MIAVVVPDITNTFYSVLTRGLADTVLDAGYGTYVCNTDGRPERRTMFLEDILDRGADGIVMAAVDTASVDALGPGNLGVPVVCIGEAPGQARVDVVAVDDEVGAHAVTLHLLRRRRRRIAMIEGPPETGGGRIAGFTRALQERGLEVRPELMVTGDWTRAGGRRAMQQLLALPRRQQPSAVFCANDLMAIGAIDAVHESGLAVPDDVAVAGFDDVDAATIVNPPLTTALNPAYDTGVNAGRLLMSRLEGDYDGDGRTIVLPCPLVVRGSA